MANNTEKVTIRPARKNDGKKIRLFLSSFPKEQVIHKHFPLFRDSVVAVTVEGRIVGHAGLDISATKMAEVRSLAVDKNFQGRGIAGNLINKLEQMARKKKIWVLFADTVAINFFKRKGYKPPKKGSAVLFKYF